MKQQILINSKDMKNNQEDQNKLEIITPYETSTQGNLKINIHKNNFQEKSEKNIDDDNDNIENMEIKIKIKKKKITMKILM